MVGGILSTLPVSIADDMDLFCRAQERTFAATTVPDAKAADIAAFYQ